MCCRKVIIKIKNIIKGWWRKILNRNQSLAEYRLNICKQCPYKENILGQDVCGLCGCVLDAKVRVEDEICYNNNW